MLDSSLRLSKLGSEAALRQAIVDNDAQEDAQHHAEHGTIAEVEGTPQGVEQITIDEFLKHTLEVKDGKVFVDGKPLLVAGKQVTTKVVLNGKVK